VENEVFHKSFAQAFPLKSLTKNFIICEHYFTTTQRSKNMNTFSFIDELKFDEKGLIPIITQDFENGQVLMLAYANRQAMELTLQKGTVHYYSRSRKQLWHKGETSGHFQYVKEILYDCDADAVLIKIEQKGAACHTGKRSCFYRNQKGEEIL